MLFTDQMGRTVEIQTPIQRIVSVVPSQTELLVDLGLRDKLVGITKFCVHPANLKKEIPLIGGTKKLNFDKIRALKPDIIIGNKEENEQSDIEQLAKEFPVWMSDIFNLEDALQMISMVGDLTETSEKVHEMIQTIQTGFEELKSVVEKQPITVIPKRVAYLIWKNPTMLAGNGTFIHDCLIRMGYQNATEMTRYPEINQLDEMNPDLIFLSSEPFPFKQKHVDELQLMHPNAKVILVDGEYFSWYGSRLIGAPNYFKELLSQ